jgi:glycosyltransferase involved in cell wall biosynthesis
MNLSIVIPIYNSSQYIQQTLMKLQQSLAFAEIQNFEIILVDDGSTDNLTEKIKTFSSNENTNLKYLYQSNQGRFAARLTGAEHSLYQNVLFMDSRVHIRESSLQNLLAFKQLNESSTCCIADITFAENQKLVGYFWDGLSRLAWHRYYASNRSIELTAKNFNSYPKGTTLVFFDREIFLKHCYILQKKHKANKEINDDTDLILEVVRTEIVNIVRNFRAVYFPRNTTVSFLKHTYSRGKVAQDGFFRRGTKARALFLVTVMMSTLIGIYALIFNRGIVFVLTLFAYLALLFLCLIRRLPIKTTLSLLLYSPIFVFFYLGGMLRASIDSRI